MQKFNNIPSIVSNNVPNISQLCQEYKVKKLIIFGSVLDGRFDIMKSDIDILVDFQAMSPEEHAQKYFSLMDSLGRLLGIKVDLIELSAIKNPYLLRSIEQKKAVLYEAA